MEQRVSSKAEEIPERITDMQKGRRQGRAGGGGVVEVSFDGYLVNTNKWGGVMGYFHPWVGVVTLLLNVCRPFYHACFQC